MKEIDSLYLQEWVCSKCTFRNKPSVFKCEMCHTNAFQELQDVPQGNEAQYNANFVEEKIEERLSGQREEICNAFPQPKKTAGRAVTLQLLKELLEEDESYGRLNGYGLKKRLILRETADRKCSWSELYRKRVTSDGSRAVGDMTYFVSHAWSYMFGSLVSSLESFESGALEREGAFY